MITIAILLVAIGLLSWGFYRAKPYGTPGILAWLQSLVLMAPWLIVFGLSAAGVFLNLAIILLLLVVSTGIYIYLGKRLRAESLKSGPTSSLKPDPFQSEFKSESLSTFTPGIQEGDRPPGLSDASEASADATSPKGPDTSAGDELSKQGVNQGGSDPNAAPGVTKEPGSAQAPAAQGLDTFPPMPEEDLKAIQGIFGIDTFFSTETVPYQGGAIFKGNLRGNPEAVHARLSEQMKEATGDRYRLYALEGPDGRPVVIVLPSANDPKPSTPGQWVLAVLLAIATIATCLETASILQGFDVFQNVERVQETLWVGGGLMAILAAHELGHWLMARQYHIRLSPPFFIPALQIGSFGALRRFESILPTRSVLFDIAAAGPVAGGIVSLVFLILGLSLSHQGSYFQIPTPFFQGSILVGTLARVVLGDQLQQPLVDIHPITIVGWLGLVITALNLMPAGQLDGGRIMQSIYGRKVARRATVVTLIVLGLATLVNPLALYWAIVILFLQRELERPSLNELTEPDDARAALGLLVLFLMAATLLPLTPGLAGRLGIGG